MGKASGKRASSPDGEKVKHLTIRQFFAGHDIALKRLWKWHDYLAVRQDVDYYLHIVGRYRGPLEDLENRRYVVRAWPLAEKWSLPEPSKPEAWIIRGWDHPLIILAAVLARFRGIPILMWEERPG